MKPILYTARHILPITAPPIEDGALLVVDGKVSAVGLRKEVVSACPVAEVVDFGDSVLLPPMVNAHTHLELTRFLDWASDAGEGDDPQSFVDWILRLVRIRQSINGGQLRESLVAGLQLALSAGTGAVGDILTSLDLADLYRFSPLFGQVYAEILGQDVPTVRKRLDDIAALLSEAPGSLLDWGLSPHTPYTLSSSAMVEAFRFADEKSLHKSVHLGESLDERSFLEKGAGEIAEKLYAVAGWDPDADRISGESPVKALLKSGSLNTRDLLVHGIQVDDEDITLLKACGCSVVLCPRSNAALGVGKAPVEKYLWSEIPLALGTDSLASAPSLSVWDELAFAQTWFPGSAKADKWLEIATLGGARALGLGGAMGSLSSGYNASFQVVCLPEMPKLEGLEAALCNGGNTVNVTHLYLSGQNVLP